MRNVILLAGRAREVTGTAGEAGMLPGMIVQMTGTGEDWVSHVAAGGFVAPVAIVRENHEDRGHGITDALDDNGAIVVLLPELGALVNVRCVDTVARGDHLTSAGDGSVKKRAAESVEAVVGVANGPTEFDDGSSGFVEMIVGAFPAVDLSV